MKLLQYLVKATYFLFFVFIASPALSQVANEDKGKNKPVDLKSLTKESQKIVQSYVDMGWFSGTVLIAKNGKPIYEEAFGYADHKKGIKNSIETKYNLGSVIKNYTAVLALQLIENGSLNLNDKLDVFELGFPKDIANKITVFHLLAHSSGFGDIFTAQYQSNRMAYDTIEKKLTLLIDKPLEFEPGTESRYSNYGYVVLGAIMEKVSSKSYSQLLQENIFAPLKLNNTHFVYREGIENLSRKYSFNYEGKQIYAGITEHPGPDGGLEADVYDVLRFYKALFNSDTLLSSASIITLQDIFDMHGNSWHSFGGGVGISAAVEIDLKSNLEIIVLANSDNLVAELISGRVFQFATSGNYPPARVNPNVFAYKIYSQNGLEYFNKHFSEEYEKAEYQTFKGRVINEVGMGLLTDKRYSKAIDMFNALVQLFPNVPQAYDSLAWGYAKGGDNKKALEAFVNAKALKPSFTSEYSQDNYSELTNE